MPIAKGKSPTLIVSGFLILALGAILWYFSEKQEGIENYNKSVMLGRWGAGLAIGGAIIAFVGMFVKGNFRNTK